MADEVKPDVKQEKPVAGFAPEMFDGDPKTGNAFVRAGKWLGNLIEGNSRRLQEDLQKGIPLSAAAKAKRAAEEAAKKAGGRIADVVQDPAAAASAALKGARRALEEEGPPGVSVATARVVPSVGILEGLRARAGELADKAGAILDGAGTRVQQGVAAVATAVTVAATPAASAPVAEATLISTPVATSAVTTQPLTGTVAHTPLPAGGMGGKDPAARDHFKVAAAPILGEVDPALGTHLHTGDLKTSPKAGAAAKANPMAQINQAHKETGGLDALTKGELKGSFDQSVYERARAQLVRAGLAEPLPEQPGPAVQTPPPVSRNLAGAPAPMGPAGMA